MVDGSMGTGPAGSVVAALRGVPFFVRMRLHIILYGFIQGIAVNLETEAEAASDTGMTDDQWMETQLSEFTALARSGRYPVFASVLHELRGSFDLDFDVLFELDLGALLDGFAHIIESRARSYETATGRRPRV